MKSVNQTAGRLYPKVEPNWAKLLPVSKIHSLYLEESGNPAGIPVVVLHGGPGGGTGPSMRRFFNPKLYRIIMFDQRGCGNSKPFADLRQNTTWDLVRDIERIRCHLNIEKWLVFGGSWGSTLSLTYAICHPERVLGLVLRGIFMGRQSELDWFYGETGAGNVYPDKWQEFVSMPGLKVGADSNYIKAYRPLLMSRNMTVRREAARRWTEWESFSVHMEIDRVSVAESGEASHALPCARLENHYFLNRCFFPKETWILDNIDRIRHIPCKIAQGRFDMVCPLKTAWQLKQAWQEAALIVVPLANHASVEPGTRRALLGFTDWFADTLS